MFEQFPKQNIGTEKDKNNVNDGVNILKES